MSFLWRLRWGLLRLAVAAFLLFTIAGDTEARLARLQYAALPDFDYATEILYLRGSGRYGEALMIADAGLDATSGPIHDAIQREKDLTLKEQSSFLRRAKDAGMGALSGRGDSIEGLIGAVAADFFIVGDARDLVIQGGRYVLDGETDELILILSGVGLATTLAPEIDWVPAVLKAARRSGALTRGLADYIIAAAKAGKTGALTALMRDIRTIAQRASPGGAARLLRHADTPEDVARLARFVEAEKSGAFALYITGKEGADLVKAGRTAERGALAAQDSTKALLAASRKGPVGIAWLRTGSTRALFRPHWLVGIAKGLYKGNAEDLARRVAAALDPRSWWIVPLLAAWFFVELGLLLRRAWPVLRPGPRPSPAFAPTA